MNDVYMAKEDALPDVWLCVSGGLGLDEVYMLPARARSTRESCSQTPWQWPPGAVHQKSVWKFAAPAG